MKKKLLIISFIIALSGNVQSQIFPNPATLSTGQGTIGSTDPVWLVSPWYTGSPPNPMGETYTSAMINNNCAPGAWVDPASLPPPVNNGNWITGSDAPCTGNAGYRYFRLPLNLPADCNGNSVTTAGNYVLYFSGYADNGISDVFINGNSTGISGGGFSSGTQLNITLVGPWVAGINYIDVLVYNGGGPYGLLLVANSTASSLADGDNDGVTDLNDQCPCQPGSLLNGCPSSIVGDTIICKGESTTLTSTGSGTYLWNTGSTNVSITINPLLLTAYSVIVSTSSGFKDSSAVNVTVNPLPIISITGDTLLCKGENTTLTATSSGTYVWNTGSTNASVTANPASTANYKVVVTNTYGCKDSLIQNVTVFPKPDATFTFTNKCNGTAVPFNSTSIINNPDVITNWIWDFGDNTIATGASTSHTYNNPGNYNANLIVNSNNSCSDTITQQISVFNTPLVGFTYNDVCFGDTMHFTNTSSVSLPASISSYLWNFGDNGSTSNLEHPSHYYSTAGAYNVTLVTTTGDGCSNAITISVNAFDAPNSGFTFNNTCLFDSAHFTNTTLDPIMGNTGIWSWDFGDGTSQNTTVWSPSHQYANPGNYQVALITHSTNLGCPDTLQNTITVFPIPLANFSFTNVCLNQVMNFNDLSIVSGGSIAARTWNFGDGTPLNTLPNTSHTYVNPGTYIVSLIVTSNNSCKDTITKSVVVHPLPVADFSTANVCNGNSIPFTNLSSILLTDTIQSYAWNFGDGSPVSSNQNTSHLYAVNGSYTVKLLIVSNFGCLDSIAKISIVNPNPIVNFTANDTIGCEPLCVSFQNSSSIATGSNIGFFWNFSNGGPTSILQNPVHCYSNDSIFSPNFFKVTLTVTSDSGCVKTISKNNYITVYPNPNTSFTAQPQTTTIVDPVISIKDLSTGANFWNWNFGDQDTSSIFNPAPHTYADTGTYVITLITTTQYNCIDTMYQTIIIEPDFIFYIPNAFSPNDDGVNDNFTGYGIFILEFEMSIFDRWGNLIYKTTDIKNPWDGKANHGTEIAQSDIYIYSIKLIDFNRRKHAYKGIVTLLR